ncbi:hypothetical protein [Flammeovirga agarivorans]|uniref:Cytochrome c domain-containing protein n=1 Tax=Flammeovirga agarivorans TaxID=2726742 RepID=A0A7X8SNW8_9BACT|nr:hypothetical protein [Flammeovirga agarivorans]NLR93669.1 hypothetical protein [Flammeovirga agarivorans]
MKKLSLLILLSTFLFCLACSEGELETPQPTTPPTTNDPMDDDDDDQSDDMDGDAVTYTNSVSTILASNCNSCHNGANPSGGLSLDSYTAAKNGTQNGNVLSRIRDVNNPMPQAGLMSEDNIKAIEDWAEGGFLE